MEKTPGGSHAGLYGKYQASEGFTGNIRHPRDYFIKRR